MPQCRSRAPYEWRTLQCLGLKAYGPRQPRRWAPGFALDRHEGPPTCRPPSQILARLSPPRGTRTPAIRPGIDHLGRSLTTTRREGPATNAPRERHGSILSSRARCSVVPGSFRPLLNEWGTPVARDTIARARFPGSRRSCPATAVVFRRNNTRCATA
ncbi:hypothetical protein C8Q73DRAFT_369611 [Cubamyces lactineus]|nr:hypothetical protein C8Q73DRAFT_369611 [Cubamyces lactineus]